MVVASMARVGLEAVLVGKGSMAAVGWAAAAVQMADFVAALRVAPQAKVVAVSAAA
jgi:hypothetical protein